MAKHDYRKTIWVNDSEPDITEDTLNNIEEGIYNAQDTANTNVDNLVALSNTVTSNKTATDESISEVKSAVDANTKNIATNASSIKTNASNIAKNTSSIITNVNNIKTNTDDIALLKKKTQNMTEEGVDMESVVGDVASGDASAKYPVGTQFELDWDRIDSSGNKTSYKPLNNVVHYGDVEVEGGTTKKGMYLEWEHTIPDGFSFNIAQALQCFDGTDGTPSGLPAGTYCLKMKAPNGGTNFKTKWNGKYAQFTLSKAIPSGGTLRISLPNGWDASADNSKLRFSTYSGYAQSDSAIESVDVSTALDSQPSGTTYLGELWGEDVGYGILNHPDCCYYGDNTWAYSDLRQWLNGDGKDWWKKLTRYNIKPNIANSLQGFLTGLPDYIKKHLQKVKVQTYSATVKYNDLKTTYDYVFLHSNNQENITTDYAVQFYPNTTEGEIWDYYKELANGVSNLNSNNQFKIWNTYPVLIRYAINAKSSPQYVFGRSAHRGYSTYVYSVSPSGNCYYARAYYGFRCLPACVIGK